MEVEAIKKDPQKKKKDIKKKFSHNQYFAQKEFEFKKLFEQNLELNNNEGLHLLDKFGQADNLNASVIITNKESLDHFDNQDDVDELKSQLLLNRMNKSIAQIASLKQQSLGQKSQFQSNSIKNNKKKEENLELSQMHYKVKEIIPMKVGSYHLFKKYSSESEQQDPNFQNWGLHTMAYFKFLKMVIWYVIIFSVLVIPSIIFYIQSAVNSKSEGNSGIDLLGYTTLGSLGQETFQCSYGTIKESDTSEKEIQIPLQCNLGKISGWPELNSNGRPIDQTEDFRFFYGVISKDAQQSNDCSQTNEDIDITTQYNYWLSDVLMNNRQKCIDQDTCQFQLQKNLFKQKLYEDYQELEEIGIYIRYYCNERQISFGKDKSVSEPDAAYIILSFDALICLLYIYMIFNIKRCQQQEVQNLRKIQLSSNLFTIQISNLPQINSEELKHKLFYHFQNYMEQYIKENNIQEQFNNIKIFDIQFGRDFIKLNLERKQKEITIQRDNQASILRKQYKYFRLKDSKHRIKEIKQLELQEKEKQNNSYYQENINNKQIDQVQKQNLQSESSQGFKSFQRTLKGGDSVQQTDLSIKEKEKILKQKAKESDLKYILKDYETIHNLELYTQNFLLNKKAYRKTKNILKKIFKLTYQKADLTDKIQEQNLKQKHVIHTAYITFETQQSKDLYMQVFQSSFWEILIGMCTKDKQNKFKYLNEKQGKKTIMKQMDLKDAPHAGNIEWRNLGFNKSRPFFYFISFIISFALIAIVFALVFYLENVSNDYEALNYDLDCNNLDIEITKQVVIEDYNKGENAVGYLKCFCENCKSDSCTNQTFEGIDSQAQQQISSSTSDKLCDVYETNIILANTIPWIIAFLLTIFNQFIESLYDFITKLERHVRLDHEGSSRIFKIFFASFLNTGIVLMLVNLRPRGFQSSVFKGEYVDFTPEWYTDVGVTIMITMFADLLIDLIIKFIGIMFTVSKQKLDKPSQKKQRDDDNELDTRCDNKQDYIDKFSGEDFEFEAQYAKILTLIYICFLYSSGIPIMYWIILFILILQYWIDKIYIVKLCKKPEKSLEKLGMIASNFLYFIIYFHIIFGIWFYSQSSMFDHFTTFEQEETLTERLNSLKTIFSKRIFIAQNLILGILLVLLLLYYLIFEVIVGIYNGIKSVCYPKSQQKIQQEFNQQQKEKRKNEAIKQQQQDGKTVQLQQNEDLDKQKLEQKQQTSQEIPIYSILTFENLKQERRDCIKEQQEIQTKIDTGLYSEDQNIIGYYQQILKEKIEKIEKEMIFRYKLFQQQEEEIKKKNMKDQESDASIRPSVIKQLNFNQIYDNNIKNTQQFDQNRQFEIDGLYSYNIYHNPNYQDISEFLAQDYLQKKRMAERQQKLKNIIKDIEIQK